MHPVKKEHPAARPSRKGRGALMMLVLLVVALLGAAGFKALSLLPGDWTDGSPEAPARPELVARAPGPQRPRSRRQVPIR